MGFLLGSGGMGWMGLRCDLLGTLGVRNMIRAIYLGQLGLSFSWRDVVA